MRDIDADFKRYFPNLNFKLKCFQKNVIENVTKVGNTLCIMPTGGGKSVIYWMAAMECDGITIVVSPLTALIEEQASKLREQGHEVLVFHSGINLKRQMDYIIERLKTLKNTSTPEQIQEFNSLMKEKMNIDRLVCSKKN